MTSGVGQKISSSAFQNRAKAAVRNAGIALAAPLILSLPLFKLMAPKGSEEVIAPYLFQSLLPRSELTFDEAEKRKVLQEEQEISRKAALIGPSLRIAGLTHLLLAGALFAFISRRWKKKDEDLEDGKFLRGLRLVSNEELQQEITSEVKSKKTGLEYHENDLILFDGKIRIPRQIGAGNFGLFGDPGTGKSQVIDSIIRQRRSFREKGIVVDPGGLFYAKHGKPGDKILSLYDTRAEPFSFWAEQVPYIPQAKVLIEDSGNENSFWSKAGQALFAGILTLARTDADIWEWFHTRFEVLKAKLSSSKLAASIAIGEEKTAASVMAVASVDLYWMEHLNYWPHSKGKTDPFSITDWVNDNDTDSWIFLVDSRANWDMSKHLVRLWFEIATKVTYDRGERKDNVPIWAICDEIATIGKLDQLVTILQEGRKFGLHLILGSQNPSQLEAIYGAPTMRTMMSALQNYILFRSTDSSMQKIESDICGSAEIEEVQISTNLETNMQSHSTRKVIRRNVLPDEFSKLKNLEGYLKLSSNNPTKISITHVDYPHINVPSVSQIPGFKRRIGGTAALEKQTPVSAQASAGTSAAASEVTLQTSDEPVIEGHNAGNAVSNPPSRPSTNVAINSKFPASNPNSPVPQQVQMSVIGAAAAVPLRSTERDSSGTAKTALQAENDAPSLDSFDPFD